MAFIMKRQNAATVGNQSTPPPGAPAIIDIPALAAADAARVSRRTLLRAFWEARREYRAMRSKG